MTTNALQTPEDIVNAALAEIGYPRPVGELYEGSAAAKAALAVYAQTRDELIQSAEWPFALREIALSPSGQTPPSPWLNEYSYPGDCLRIRYVRPGPLTGGTRSNDPQPVLFRPWNDNRPGTPIRAILCDVANAVLVYDGQVTNPANWEPQYTMMLVSLLAKKLAFALQRSADVAKLRVALAGTDMAEAMNANDMMPPAEAASGTNR